MKQKTKFILFLIIFNLSLLTACGGQQSTNVTAQPNADHVVKFNEEGIAVLRGYISGGYFKPSSNPRYNTYIRLDVPAKVQGIDAKLAIPFTVISKTIISSSVVSETDVEGYHIHHPGSDVFGAFPSHPLVEVTFLKKGTEFEVLSIHEVRQKFNLFQKKAVIDNVFSESMFVGSIHLSKKDSTGAFVWWNVSIPIDVQGIQSGVVLVVHSAPDTTLITPKGVVPLTGNFSGDHMQVQFTRWGDKLTASQITELP